MKYKIKKENIPAIRKFLIEADLEFHKEFEMNFVVESIYSGRHILEFFRSEDEAAFLLKFDDTFYEKSNN